MASFYQKNKTLILAIIIIGAIVGNLIIGSQTWLSGLFGGSTTFDEEDHKSLTGSATVNLFRGALPTIPGSLETTVLQDASFLALHSLPVLKTIKPERVTIEEGALASFGEVLVKNSGIGNSLTITWQEPLAESLASIRLYRSTSFGTLGNVVADLEPSQRSFKDTDVRTGSTYYYTLRGVDTNGLEATELFQHPGRAFDIVPPESPTNVRIEAKGERSVQVSWDEPNVDDYDFSRVYRSTLPGQLGKLVGELIRESTFTDTTNVPGVTYYYTVTAVDTSLNESPRDTAPSLARKILELTGILAKGDILLLITTITAEGADTGNAIELSWTNPNDSSFDHVRIYRSETFNTVGTLIVDLPPGANSYTDTNVARDTTYYYTLRTVDVEGRESDNTIQYVAVARDVTGPAVPTNIRVAQSIPSRVDVTWGRPGDTDLAFYRVYRSTTKDAPGHLVADNVISEQWTDADIEDNRVYYYVVTSVDLSGNESEKPLSASILGGRIPFAPITE